MDYHLIEDVKDFVKRECANSSVDYSKEWVDHLESVSSNALKLADKLGADKEVVILASWLHDIGSIVKEKIDHHITGAKIAEEKLTELGYPREKIEMVKHCIFSHRASQNIKRESIEAQIVADADSMAHFDNTSDLIKAEKVFRNTPLGEARKLIRQKLVRSWNKLSPEAQKLVKLKYEKQMALLK